MVEEASVAGVHAVSLAETYNDPVGLLLGHHMRPPSGRHIGAARTARRCQIPPHFLRQAVRLAGAVLTKGGLLGQPEVGIASSGRSVLTPSATAVYSGCSKLAATWLVAPRLQISVGSTSCVMPIRFVVSAVCGRRCERAGFQPVSNCGVGDVRGAAGAVTWAWEDGHVGKPTTEPLQSS